MMAFMPIFIGVLAGMSIYIGLGGENIPLMLGITTLLASVATVAGIWFADRFL